MYEKPQRDIKRQCYTRQLSNIEFVQDLLNGNPDIIYNMFFMDKKVFIQLCYTFEYLQLLEHDRHICINEAVAMYLYLLSHGVDVQVVFECFQCSIDTIFTHFKHLLKALCHLAKHIIKAKPQAIRNSPNFFFHILR